MEAPKLNVALEELRKALELTPERPFGKGWMTMDELAAFLKIAKCGRLYNRVNRALANGVLEAKKGRAIGPRGSVCRMTFYRLKKEKKHDHRL